MSSAQTSGILSQVGPKAQNNFRPKGLPGYKYVAAPTAWACLGGQPQPLGAPASILGCYSTQAPCLCRGWARQPQRLQFRTPHASTRGGHSGGARIDESGRDFQTPRITINKIYNKSYYTIFDLIKIKIKLQQRIHERQS